MKLYKYKSLRNLWHVLDIIVNSRLYCAHWSELNDPLEGRYEVYLGNKEARLKELLVGQIELKKDSYRVASLSASADAFLLWSHYADGHKGVAIEVNIPEDDPDLLAVTYSPFSSVFTKKLQTEEDVRHLFNGKSEEWAYEREYRVVASSEYFQLPVPVARVLIGPMVDEDQLRILRSVIPSSVELAKTHLDTVQGVLRFASET